MEKKGIINQQDCLIKAEHIILEKRPFIIISLKDEGYECLIHTALVTGNRIKLDIALMDMTDNVDPGIKLMWALNNMKKLNIGENTDENKG